MCHGSNFTLSVDLTILQIRYRGHSLFNGTEAILLMEAQHVVSLMSTKVSSAAMELYDQNILKSKVCSMYLNV